MTGSVACRTAAVRTLGQLREHLGQRQLQSVGNALKTYGDQHLARIHDTADRRLRLHDWERSVRVKLDALEAIYGKLRDAHHQRRSEILEWIIIVLIATEIAFTLLGVH